MSGAIWLAAIALLALPGTIVWRLPFVARMGRAARWALAFATGAFVAALVMYVYAVAGVHWTRVNIALPLVVLAVLGLRRPATADPLPQTRNRRSATGDRILLAVILIILTYAILDARATCGDLVYIWGPKAQAFTVARTIDTKFLAFPHYYLMHPDYPPLVPMIYSWGSIAAHHFAWWGALLLSVGVVASLAGVLYGFGASSRSVVFVVAVLTYGFVFAYVAGGADPFLLLFEGIAVIALTFAPESRDAQWIAAASLAAAAFCKVEGLSFAIIVAFAFLLTQRRVGRAIALLAPTLILIGSWLLFARHYKLLDQYARARTPMHWPLLPGVLGRVGGRAAYGALWLPWIAALVPSVWRPARFPLLVGAGAFAATIFFYLHTADPWYWIDSSADRILLTPLLCLAVAASAAGADAIHADRPTDAAIRPPA